MLQNPDYRLFLTGNFNHLNISYLWNSFDLENVVQVPTRNNAILDLVLLSSSISDLYDVNVGPPIATSDHRSILCSPKITCKAPSNRQCTVYDLRESNIAAFLSALQQVNFIPFYNTDLPLRDKTLLLNEAISDCLHRCIPAQSVIMTAKDKPYVTPLIKSLINMRWLAYRQRNFPVYNHLHNKIKKMILVEKKKWARRAHYGPKEMWKVVNEATGDKSSKSSAIDLLIKQFSSPQAAADEINAAFASTQAPSSVQTLIDVETDWAPTITVESVFNALSSLNPSKAAGIDSIPTVIY